MEEKTDKVKQIIDYLDDKLEGQSLEEFENQIENDLDLQKEVQDYNSLKDGVIAYGEMTLKEELEVIHQRTFPDSYSRFSSLRRWGPIAASILFLIALAWWWNSNQKEPDLFKEYYAVYTIPASSRSTASELKLLAANELYQRGSYKEAISLFEEIDKPDGRVSLALGICHLELDQFETAQSLFTDLINSPDQDIYQNLAQWYLALSYLKQEQPGNAEKWLEILANNVSADKHEEAKQILQELEN